MKKVLIGTTALVLSTGAAFAAAHNEVTIGVSGAADIWLSDSDAPGTDIQFNNSIDVSFSGSGETDGGLGFGFDYTIIDAVSADSGTGSVTAIGLDNWEVYVSGAFGKVVVGDPDDALQSVAGIGDIGFDGLGVDNVAEQGRGDGAANGVLYSNSFGPASVYLSINKDTGVDDVAAGVKFSAGDITIGLGYEDQGGADLTAADVSGSFGGIGFDIYFEDGDTNGSGWGTIIKYDAGVATISFGYADHDASADAAMGVGFSMDLGGGANLAGGVADNGSVTAWDLGIGMSF